MSMPLPEYENEWKLETPYSVIGLEIVLEYLTGQRRAKKRPDGSTFENIMPAPYGRILGTTDRHGEEVDVYLHPNVTPDGAVFVIDQICLATGQFDEHKVMIGFGSLQEVVELYNDVFPDGLGKKRIGAVTRFPLQIFHEWFRTDGSLHQPASAYRDKDILITQVTGISIPRQAISSHNPIIDEAGGVQIELPSLANGPKLKLSANEDGGTDYTLYLFSPIETDVWSNCFDRAIRALDLATEKDTFRVFIASPGGSVFLMGRLASAMRTTKALVETYAQGSVASAATTIWAEGQVRHILPGAFFMQHMSSQLMAGKTNAISAKTTFCLEYITAQLQRLVEIRLYTQQEVEDMVVKGADVFISGREGTIRHGKMGGESAGLESLESTIQANTKFEAPDEHGWGAEFGEAVTAPELAYGMESFILDQATPNTLSQGLGDRAPAPWFNPVSITAENGIFFASIYVCRLADDTAMSQRFAIWLGSLKETDTIRLSVAATVTNIPFACLVTLLGALANTKATVEIMLDQIVMDGLAYFYLLADKIIARHAGALYVQSFVDQRIEDVSPTWKAIHDFYQWIVEAAAVRNILTEDEAAKIKSGADIVLPLDRFSV